MFVISRITSNFANVFIQHTNATSLTKFFRFMTETIPNPLTDKGVQKDIQDKVAELMNRSVKTSISPVNVSQYIEHLVKRAAEWGMSEGFRMGWRIYEVRHK